MTTFCFTVASVAEELFYFMDFNIYHMLVRFCYSVSQNIFYLNVALLIFSIKSRFQAINFILKYNFGILNNTFHLKLYFRNNKKLDTVTIKKLSKLHDILCDITVLLNKNIGIQFVLLLTNVTLFDLFCFFEMFHITKFLTTLTIEEIVSCVYDIIWMFFDFYFIACVVVSSELLSKEAIKTKILLHRIENHLVDYKLVKTVSTQIFFRKIYKII